VVYPRLSDRRSRGLWARANTLAARGLAPLPLAMRSDLRHTLLICRPEAGARAVGAGGCGAAERGAVARLLRELEGFGELREGLAPEDLVLVPAGAARVHAQLLAPHAFRFGGRSGGPGSRRLAARLLASLTADAGV
jgi:hypothetical protein